MRNKGQLFTWCVSELRDLSLERKMTFFFLWISFFFFNFLGGLFVCLFVCLFIYLFIGCVGSSFLCEGFLQLRRAGATLHRDARASHYRGLSCCGAQAPDAQAQ